MCLSMNTYIKEFMVKNLKYQGNLIKSLLVVTHGKDFCNSIPKNLASFPNILPVPLFSLNVTKVTL